MNVSGKLVISLVLFKTGSGVGGGELEVGGYCCNSFSVLLILFVSSFSVFVFCTSSIVIEPTQDLQCRELVVGFLFWHKTRDKCMGNPTSLATLQSFLMCHRRILRLDALPNTTNDL